MNRLYVFVQGMLEFRQTFTTYHRDYDTMRAYDQGREWAHRLTFRYFDF